MSHPSGHWRSAIYGVGLTLVLLAAPAIYIVLAAPRPDGRTRSIGRDSLTSGYFGTGLAGSGGLVLSIAAIGLAILVSIGCVIVRSQSTHDR